MATAAGSLRSAAGVADAHEVALHIRSVLTLDRRSSCCPPSHQVVPADLNAYLYDMERNIAAFATALGDVANAKRFAAAADTRAAAIQDLMWDASTGACCASVIWQMPHVSFTLNAAAARRARLPPSE